MKKQGPLVLFVLVTSSVVVAAQAPSARPSPTSSPSPAAGPVDQREAMRRIQALPPAERREAMRKLLELRQAERAQARASAKPAVAPRENQTQVEVVSVDTAAGTMTFNDVEGESNTWRFEPAAMAHDPVLKPGTRVRIAWKSDKTGEPVPTILGVVAVVPPSPRAPAGRPSQGRRQGPPRGPSPSPAASPTPPPSR